MFLAQASRSGKSGWKSARRKRYAARGDDAPSAGEKSHSAVIHEVQYTALYFLKLRLSTATDPMIQPDFANSAPASRKILTPVYDVFRGFLDSVTLISIAQGSRTRSSSESVERW